jgi:hypothetical protein
MDDKIYGYDWSECTEEEECEMTAIFAISNPFIEQSS